MNVMPALVTGTEAKAGYLGCRTGDLEVRLAGSADEVEAAKALRYRIFYEELNAGAPVTPKTGWLDSDIYDDHCQHLLVVDRSTGRNEIVGTYRLIDEAAAEAAGSFYSESEYDLSPLLAPRSGRHRRMLELGRSCVAPAYRKSSAISLLWRGIAALCEMGDVRYLFGCASFPGTDVDPLAGQLGYLHRNHLSRTGIRARPERFVPMHFEGTAAEDRIHWRALPPLIRGYLRVGAEVGDGAVIDHDFGTTDVFMILDTSEIRQQYRARFLPC